MATVASTTTQLAKIGQFPWTADLARMAAFGNGNLSMNGGRDIVLLVENEGLEWGIANNLDGLDGVNNFVYQLVGDKLKASMEVFSTGSGGVVPSPSGSGSYQPAFIDYTVVGMPSPNTTITSITNSDWEGLLGLTELGVNQQVFQLNVGFNFNSAQGKIEFDLSGTSGNIYYPQNGDKITANGLYKIVTA